MSELRADFQVACIALRNRSRCFFFNGASSKHKFRLRRGRSDFDDDQMRGLSGVAFRLLVTLALGIVVIGCNNGEDLVVDKSKVATPIGGVGHYGAGVSVTEFALNGSRGGRVEGWGGGGAGNCCVMIPRANTKPLMVSIHWTTTRTDVDEFKEHDATVPVNFSARPGQGSGLYVHFLPGHQVEVWYAMPWPSSPEYPGPPYPGGAAPPYVPLPGEQPRSVG